MTVEFKEETLDSRFLDPRGDFNEKVHSFYDVLQDLHFIIRCPEDTCRELKIL